MFFFVPVTHVTRPRLLLTELSLQRPDPVLQLGQDLPPVPDGVLLHLVQPGLQLQALRVQALGSLGRRHPVVLLGAELLSQATCVERKKARADFYSKTYGV